MLTHADLFLIETPRDCGRNPVFCRWQADPGDFPKFREGNSRNGLTFTDSGARETGLSDGP